MAADVPALIMAVEYRLATEHRFPVAYDDATEAIEWVWDQAREVNGCDPWMKEMADFNQVYLFGSSAGANIMYRVDLRTLDADLEPIKIVGLIMNQPSFGEVERTPSELKFVDDKIVPLMVNDFLWSLVLSKRSDRDHEYSNPLIDRENADKIRWLPKCLVRGFGGDPLVDRQKRLAEMLVTLGVQVVTNFEEGGCHGAELIDPKKSDELYALIKKIVSDSTPKSTL